ncbi:TBC1 domain family member 16 [Lycorma delicatula]|uniref:TBC1 domain family member 16 n=1 Tax=Lycorma delicatula TaxID=130591 RepID=UPI003F50E61A
MPLSRIFKKASNFILRSQDNSSSAPSYSDGEVVFCKNNVCVHPPALVRQETDILHHPGYLTVTCQVIDDRRTLFLSWIPNTTLRRHPSTVEQRSLSVTRLQDSHCKDGEVRRSSASSLIFPNHSRRNSSGSYETECSGCFPENQTNLSPLSPQLHLKIKEGRIYRSSSLSSNSDNNSLSLTPTESVKDCVIMSPNCDEVEEEEEEEEEEEVAVKKEINKLDNNSISESFVTHNNIIINNCDDDLIVKNSSSTSLLTVDSSINISSDFNIHVAEEKEVDLSLMNTESSSDASAYLNNKTLENNGSDNLKSDTVSVALNSNSNTDQSNVPNKKSSSNLVNNVDDVDGNNFDLIDGDLGKSNISIEVPNKSVDNNNCRSNNNDFSDKKENNNSTSSNESDENSDVHDSKCSQASVNNLRQKLSNAQYTFSRPDGIVYVDTLLLHENPHLLSNSSSSSNNISSNFISSINSSKENCQQNNYEFVKKRNFDNLKVDDAKSLPLRSYEENFAPSWMSSPELLALKHNLNFPESATASPVVRRTQRCCRKFCVDLSEMRSLRLFFSDAESTKGQLVIASRECQYKILHFHHSGLERLATVLQQWHLLTVVPHCDNLPYRHFMVCRPAVHDNELHPEEGKVGMVTMADWLEMLNPLGQVEDDLALRKGIFLGGLDPSLRKLVWPFLLHCFSYQSTTAEREQIMTIRRQEYEQITNRRLSLEGAAKERFLRNIQCVVEKDVIRTDRGNPYYAGESNPHLETMKNILLNYAVYDAGLGYLQGMSDLLAPLLAEIGTEADTFWCFVGLMRRTIFVCTPTDSDMERNLTYLRELIREMVPDFYAHLQRHTDAMELLFCHRWILLCFKREFPEEMALKMWEACWANYLTDYFNLFLCLAIVSAYADDVIAQDLRTDEMLLHFSSLAMFMDGELILRKARGLLYQFRQKPVIPCTLAGLCMQCGPGMWDSGHAPTVVCQGTDCCKQNPCPYRGTTSSLN